MISLDNLIALSKRKEQLNENIERLLIRYARISNKKEVIVFPKTYSNDSDFQTLLISNSDDGFLIYLPNLVMAVDPGQNFIYRLVKSHILIPQINTIFLSRENLSKTNIQLLLNLLKKSHHNIHLICSEELLKRNEFQYHKANSTTIMSQENEEIILKYGNYLFTSHNLQSEGSYFGFTLEYKSKRISHITNTLYAKKVKTSHALIDLKVDKYVGTFISIIDYYEEIKAAIMDTNILIVNIGSLEYSKGSISQLTIHDVIHMVKGTAVEQLIITPPIGTGFIQDMFARKLRKYLAQQTGLKIKVVSSKGLEIKVET